MVDEFDVTQNFVLCLTDCSDSDSLLSASYCRLHVFAELEELFVGLWNSVMLVFFIETSQICDVVFEIDLLFLSM